MIAPLTPARTRLRIGLVCAVIAACGAACGTAGTAPTNAGPAGDDGGGSDGATSAGTFPLMPPADAGADASLVIIYDKCLGVAPKPLTAGSLTESRSGATLHWPAGWSQVGTSQSGGASEPYTYVATNATAPTSSTASMSISASGVSSDMQGQDSIQGWVNYAQQNGGNATLLTKDGHPAVLWWDEVAPPQPGCQGCPGDPGPDLIEVGFAAYLGDAPDAGGLITIEVHGAARINAQPPEIICDMEQIAAGVTLAK